MFGYDFFLHLCCDSGHFSFHFAVVILLWSLGVLFNNIYKKNHKTQWNPGEGMANSRRDVYWAKVTQHLTLSHRYSQLVASRCWLVCSLLEIPFVTWDVFVFGKFVRDERHSWTEIPLYYVIS
jgi:hypothetical protein